MKLVQFQVECTLDVMVMLAISGAKYSAHQQDSYLRTQTPLILYERIDRDMTDYG